MPDLTQLLRRAATPLAAAAFLAAPAGAETLRLAHFVPPAHVITSSVVDPLVNGVFKDSGGNVTIKVYPGGELGPGPVEQYVRAVTGVADITWGLAGYNSQQFPLSMIVELPGVVDAAGSGYDAMWRAYEDHLTGEFLGTIPLALWTSEPNVLILKDKDVRTPEDLAGLKIRVSGAFPGRVIEALGATPVQMPATEMYNALQTGLIDGIMTGASAILDFKINEVANVYVEGPSLGNILFYLVMNREKYDALSDADRAALDANIGPELSKSGEEGWNARATEAMDMLRADPAKTVITLSAEDSEPFNAITIPLRDEVVAELEAQGLPAAAVVAAMTGQ
jgi:TRAP-type C4-dicarboxylate transport system substrate-binding protein